MLSPLIEQVYELTEKTLVYSTLEIALSRSRIEFLVHLTYRAHSHRLKLFRVILISIRDELSLYDKSSVARPSVLLLEIRTN